MKNVKRLKEFSALKLEKHVRNMLNLLSRVCFNSLKAKPLSALERKPQSTVCSVFLHCVCVNQTRVRFNKTLTGFTHCNF